MIPICPHCGQLDEENTWLAKQQDEEYDDIYGEVIACWLKTLFSE